MAETPYHRVGLSADAIRMGITGGIRIQNDMSKPIVDGFAAYDDKVQVPLGYITKDGVEVGREEDKAEIEAWQELNPVRVEITKSQVTVKATLLQSDLQTNSLFYGVDPSAMTTNADGSVTITEQGHPELKNCVLYLDVVDKDKARRIVLANARITERGSMKYTTEDAVVYEVTWTAFPGKDGWSVKTTFKEGWKAETTATPGATS